MERRIASRFRTDQAVTVTDLENNDQPIQGTLVNLSDHGFGLVLEAPLPINAAVRVDIHDAVLLGEVCYCQPLPGGSGYAIGIRAEHVLTDCNELAALMRSLEGESPETESAPQPEPNRH